MLGPVQQLRSSSSTLSIELYWIYKSSNLYELRTHLVNLSSECNVMISELSPRHEQECECVVMEPIVTVNMS